VRLDDFVLDLVCPLLLVFLFERAAVFVKLFRVSLDLNDPFLCLPTHLLEDACKEPIPIRKVSSD